MKLLRNKNIEHYIYLMSKERICCIVCKLGIPKNRNTKSTGVYLMLINLQYILSEIYISLKMSGRLKS